MKKTDRNLPTSTLTDPSRRRFVQGLMLGGAAAAVGTWSSPLWAANRTALPSTSASEYDLRVAETAVNFTGNPALACTVDGQLPGPVLRWREGSTVTLRVTNRMKVPTSIHWHGIVLPYQMDGVPGISFPGIAPGETFVYRFPIRQSGTYWYHAHTHFQEQIGLYGPIIIDPAHGERVPTDREYVVMLNDWTDMDPERIFAILRTHGEYFNFNQLTVRNFISDASMLGLRGALQAHGMWDRMRMSPRDLIDISGFTYTYLMNGTTPASNWTGLFRPGERIRLRFINGSANSYFDVRIPGLKLTVVSADGQDVEPVAVDEFRMAVAETYDVIVQPTDDRAYTIFAQSIDRSGYARGTLAPRAGMQAEVPRLDPVPTLAPVDMMGAMAQADGAGAAHNAMPGMKMDDGGSSHASMPGMKMDHGAMTHESMPGMTPAHDSTTHESMPEMKMDHGSMDHDSAKGMPMADGSMDHQSMPAMDHDSMPGMNHAAVDHESMPSMDHATMNQESMQGMNHASAGRTAKPEMTMDHGTMATTANHARTEYGNPGVAMRIDMPRTNLDDPGAGLRNNGRRVLTYADLRSVDGPLDKRSPSREIELHLTGNMERFVWSFDGVPFHDAKPIHFRPGERLRIVLVNDTMMNHPIHLHGMFSELENPQGEVIARKHTVNVQPAQRITYALTADNPGRWAYHCHLLYHMEAGMFREVITA